MQFIDHFIIEIFVYVFYKMNILYTRSTDLHHPIDNHFERPERLQKTIDFFSSEEKYSTKIYEHNVKESSEILDLIKEAQGEKVMKTFLIPKLVKCSDCEIEYVTTEANFRKVRSIVTNDEYERPICPNCDSTNSTWYFSNDTYVCSNSIDAVIESVSLVTTAIDNILEQNKRVQYCIIRPPGHHNSVKGRGFCLVNNVWIGTEYALKRGYRRPLVFDYDTHHFDGFSELVKKNKNRFGISVHGWSNSTDYHCYPGTGSGKSSNNNILNIPLVLTKKEDREIYTDYVVLETILHKAVDWIRERNPDIIFVSNGMDGHKDDPIGYSYLTGIFYSEMAKILLTFNVPLIYVQEGGYNPDAVLECSKAIVDVLIDY